jgi:predicted acetyltransferase
MHQTSRQLVSRTASNGTSPFLGERPGSVVPFAPRSHHPCLRELDAATKIVVGNAGDHSRILSLLMQHYQTPLGDDFQSRLDEPSYEPTDRMLVVHHGQLIGQAQLSRQSAWFDHERMPVAALRDFVILPEMQSAGFREPLLETAEATALAEGAILAVARPEDPDFFAGRGWSLSRAQGHTQANTRALLAHLTAQLANRKHRSTHIEIRTWWHFELEAIQPVYEQVATAMWGTLQRSDDAWRWLVGRKAHDQILIAIRHKSEEHAESAELHVVGYAVIRDSCIMEMVTLPGHAAVRPLLAARACRDAIDRDHHFVSLHTPPTDPLHELLVTAGGSWHASTPHGGQWMEKLLSPEKWVERLYPQLYRRAREAGIPRPLEIGFAVDERRYRFVFTRRSVRLEHTLPSAKVNVTCDGLTFQNLLLSNLTWPTAMERGLLRVDDPQRAALLAALFPPRLFWQSPFELLRL